MKHKGVRTRFLLLLTICCSVQAQYNYIEQICGDDDFRCNNGMCIEGSRRCDRIVDCSDREDEENCECNDDEFRCLSDGSCIEMRKRCDNISHCADSSDEIGCASEQFRCRSGKLIHQSLRCNRQYDCPRGDYSDEQNCRVQRCPPDTFTCPADSSVPCAKKCNSLPECSGGEDEEDCDKCNHECDGRCLQDSQICNGVPDCSDSSDELQCADCEGPEDFRCRSGECINIINRCNQLQECLDNSDEEDCNNTMTPPPYGCIENQFQCRSDGACINDQFVCDGNADCHDNSDEEDCQCDKDQWKCKSGQCIPVSAYCNDYFDCEDNSDEQNCPTSPPYFTTTYSPYRPAYPPVTTQAPFYNNVVTPYPQPGIGGPIPLNLRTYPDGQTVRNGKYLSGGDVVFLCRDEGPLRAPVRWVREYGKPLKLGSIDVKGRLEMNQVSPADSGTYICQAPRYLGQPGSELRVSLSVDATPIYKPQPPAFDSCRAHEATCGNGQCISKTQVCDGRRDCTDGSDEDSCHNNGLCEPNQFQCANRRCVLKTWLCDSEDDCMDGSDEQNCGVESSRQMCTPVEFKCLSNDQCVPKSFHCDGQSDCRDGSDEIGCAPVHITKPPTPSNIRLTVGETLTLTCESVGIPVPLISWRLNWGHVPSQCVATSINGIGKLICPYMQPEHSGAYSCEGINNIGTVFAYPDAIVFVSQTDVCPAGFFNSEAQSESECIRCFCFGESTQCRSADLFTYNMPTPLGEGGTRLVDVKVTNGQIEIDKKVSNQYFYQPLWNGATITKLDNYGNNWYPSLTSDTHPYLTLPETYNGNQLTSYGGHINYNFSPHKPARYSSDSSPEIIIKGKYETLVHIVPGGRPRQITVKARLTPENWMKVTPSGLTSTTREDIMMALDNIETILLRGDFNNAGTNITDFSMESAQHINVGLGAANLVEECTCPPGYEGLSCQKCAAGYVHDHSGPWLGACVRERQCPPGEYGYPNNGMGCRPCPCPLTNPDNQFARTCSVGPDGDVICDCLPGYTGRNCERCDRGYVGNPLIPGDSCKIPVPSNCNPVGTLRSPMPNECQCKDHVTGRYCDQCKNDSFYLSADFRQGCALCFCSGVSQQCQSSNLRRKTNNVRFNSQDIADQVKIYTSAPSSPGIGVRYNAPVLTSLQPRLLRGELGLTDLDRSQNNIYYWSLPLSFIGDKVKSYGGFLRYTLRQIPPPNSYNSRNNAADVLLMSEYSPTFHYFGDIVPDSDGMVNASVQFLEKGWQRPDGKEIAREHFLLSLADVSAILVKATYAVQTDMAIIESASIETADANGNGPQALHVEECICPAGYIGTSCEDCAPGYTRNGKGLYLEQCGLCECNGHSSNCHPETGVCYECRDNTAGDKCEQCKLGYEKDEFDYCVPTTVTNITNCRCDPSGTDGPCESNNYCRCKQNVQGNFCNTCRPGSFGLSKDNPLGCLSCYCSGVTTDCYEAEHYMRIPMPASMFGIDYGGYSITNLNGDLVINDQFVPAPKESELLYIFSSPPDQTLYWSLPVFPGNRLLSYGGSLSLTQTFESGGYSETSTPGTDVIFVGDSDSVYWSNPTPLSSGQPLSYQVPIRENGWYVLNSATPASRSVFMAVLKNLRRVLVRATLSRTTTSTAIADVAMDTVTELSPGFTPAKEIELCKCPIGYTGTSCENCLPGWYADQYGRCNQCNCNGHDCQLGNRNEVVCNCRPPFVGPDCSNVAGTGSTTEEPVMPSPPNSTVIVRITSPTFKIQEVGSSVNFSCQAQSVMTTQRLPITWTKVGGPLPQGRSQVDNWSGILLITNLQMSDSGKYICETMDGVSTAQAIATLKVPGNDMTMPTVTIDPPTGEYYEGERVTLRCIVSGNPAPRITWQRATSRALSPSANTYDGTLILENARQEDSGEYRCIATNAIGTTDRVAMVVVRPRMWPSDRLTVSPQTSQVTEGQSTRIVCTGTSNMPAGSIEWIRQDGGEFQANVRTDNGVLYIDKAVRENQGVYICRAISSGVQSIPVTLIVILTSPPNSADASNITVPVDRLTIPTGGSGSVECTPSGYPLPFIRWKKHNGSFGPGVSQRDNTLIISNAQEDDQGYYQCEGVIAGETIENIFVYVEIEKREPPKVVIYPQGEQAVPLGQQFEFHCRVLGGVPVPDVTWDRSGGRQLSLSTQILPQNVLRFESVEVNDEGEYSCTATNVAGRASASAVLKVRSPPEITIMPRQYLVVENGDYVKVECRATGYPEPQVSISRDDYREVVRASPGIATLYITSVTERDAGIYVCTATSAAGTSEEQFAIRFARGDGGVIDEGGSGEGDLNTYIDNGEPRSMVFYEGDPFARLECDVNGDNRWNRIDAPLQNNAVASGSVLTIYNVSKSDAGQYECSVIDSYTQEVQQAAYTNVVVVAPPKITLQPKTQTVLPGSSPSVECIVEGDDIVDVLWRPLDKSSSRRMETRGNTLTFHQIEVEDAGRYQCFARNRYGTNATADAEVIVNGQPDEEMKLVTIDQPNRAFRVGENVEVLCRANSRDVKAEWERYANQQRQYVENHTYGDGSKLVIRGVQEADAGLYRCIGRDRYNRASYEDFILEVIPVSISPPQPINEQDTVYTVALGRVVDLPCNNNLDEPVQYEWRREYTSLPPDTRTTEQNLHLAQVTEADAGAYVCRVSNRRTATEARAILRVEGVVPQFGGESWLSLPTLKDAYRQFDIEISFKPSDSNGLILYNSQNYDRTGDYIALQLLDGVPQFVIDTGSGPLIVRGDRPLPLNTWHTIRLSKTNSKLTMDVDNTGPFVAESLERWDILDLAQPLYIGGVPDYNQLPAELAGASGFFGCVSMLILGREEKNIMVDSTDRYAVRECDSCTPNLCLNNGVCQEARNERGYICFCSAGFAGHNCDRTGEACRPGVCGLGKCTDTTDGYKCACPVNYTGRNCEAKQSIEYPAFTGSAYLAIKPPKSSRTFRMSMKVKPTAPVSDGIIMYCAESAHGYGGFISLAVRNGRLEFRYDLGDGSPVVLTSNRTLPANTWTDVRITRMGPAVSLKIDVSDVYQEDLKLPKKDMHLETPMFVGGVDSIVLNNNTGVTGGFNGCIKDVQVYGERVDIVNASILSANVQECSNYDDRDDRGDIPEFESLCSQCRNGGRCITSDATACTCPTGFTGLYCETRVPLPSRRPQSPIDPCLRSPCRNGGTCKPDNTAAYDRNGRLNYTCDCPLDFAGTTCQMPLKLLQSVGFLGNGYLELPASLLRYDNRDGEPAVIALAFHTTSDGVLLYQREAINSPNYGDFILLRIENGRLVLNWELGSGPGRLSIDEVYVNNGERHDVIAKFYDDNTVSLTVDRDYTRSGSTIDLSNLMNADSSIYIGGIPEMYNHQHYAGLSGCIEQVELMDMGRGLNLGSDAVGGKNTHRCRDSRNN